MKKSMFLFACLILFANLNAQQTFTINQGAGDTFDPATLSVNQGDIIHFNLASPHDVTQVSLATWNANGITPLAGGFLFSTGSGTYTTTTPGTIYYVCTQHVVEHGMKGTIIVNVVTGINDTRKDEQVRVYPNPASAYITYQTNRKSAVTDIRILDIYGKAVKILQKPEISDKNVRINIEDLNKGIYFIIVTSDAGIEHVKFLKS